MRRPLQIALGIGVLVLAATTMFFYSRYQDSASSYAAAKASEQNTQQQYAQTIGAIAEIQDSLNAIALGDHKLGASSLGAEPGLSGPDRRQTLERIELLRASIQRNRERIVRLERDLHRSGVRNAGLERLVADLKRTTTEKEERIAQLTSQVTDLQTQVGGLTTQVQQTQDTVRALDGSLAERQRQLATVYYVTGTKRALTRSGVIVAKGGVLGLGRTLLPSAKVDDGTFKPLNTDEETVLPLASARAQVLTAQPASSYELRLVNGQMELHILDPERFRKVRQLVIVTA